MSSYYTQKPDCMVLAIYVKPNAKKTHIVCVTEQGLNIALKAKPVEGEANKELIRFLSKYLKIPQLKIQIIGGDKSRLKRVKISHTIDFSLLP